MSEIFFLCYKEILLLNNYKKVWILKSLLNFLFYLYVYINFYQISQFTPPIFSLVYFMYLYIICVNLNYFLSKEKENNYFELVYLSNINIKLWFGIKLLIFFIFTELPFCFFIFLFNYAFLYEVIDWTLYYYLVSFFMLNVFISQLFCAFISLITIILKQNNLLALFLLLVINLPMIILLEHVIFDVNLLQSVPVYQVWFLFSSLFLVLYTFLIEYLFKYLIN